MSFFFTMWQLQTKIQQKVWTLSLLLPKWLWSKKNPGKFDMLGFLNCNYPAIEFNKQGFKRLELLQKWHKRRENVIQSSKWQVLSQRANCDIQPRNYESYPKCPDFKEIACITDYIVAYACKGIETFSQEKETIALVIYSAQEKTNCHRDVCKVGKKILNKR